ncbi:MAG: NADH-quinone oxidoreductase subunit [Burkholderiales bacterium]|jgi:NADH-quinone oxidoreductase subunit C|nr:NADH-quinone oxidoreductase subunit [Burkholderiales bacterium]
MSKIQLLKQSVEALLGTDIQSSFIKFNELTIMVEQDNIVDIMLKLRDSESTKFEICLDLCGVDYLTYHDDYCGPRFAVVYHLLSVTHNFRIRVKAFLKNDSFPLIKSISEVYAVANWYEREAFDLYGIIFANHPDLRRLLTDYGFIGHPFRKDFPIYGHMEMRYDEEQKRVIYQNVTIEPREIIPRVIREEQVIGRD